MPKKNKMTPKEISTRSLNVSDEYFWSEEHEDGDDKKEQMVNLIRLIDFVYFRINHKTKTTLQNLYENFKDLIDPAQKQDLTRIQEICNKRLDFSKTLPDDDKSVASYTFFHELYKFYQYLRTKFGLETFLEESINTPPGVTPPFVSWLLAFEELNKNNYVYVELFSNTVKITIAPSTVRIHSVSELRKTLSIDGTDITDLSSEQCVTLAALKHYTTFYSCVSKNPVLLCKEYVEYANTFNKDLTSCLTSSNILTYIKELHRLHQILTSRAIPFIKNDEEVDKYKLTLRQMLEAIQSSNFILDSEVFRTKGSIQLNSEVYPHFTNTLFVYNAKTNRTQPTWQAITDDILRNEKLFHLFAYLLLAPGGVQKSFANCCLSINNLMKLLLKKDFWTKELDVEKHRLNPNLFQSYEQILFLIAMWLSDELNNKLLATNKPKPKPKPKSKHQPKSKIYVVNELAIQNQEKKQNEDQNNALKNLRTHLLINKSNSKNIVDPLQNLHDKINKIKKRTEQNQALLEGYRTELLSLQIKITQLKAYVEKNRLDLNFILRAEHLSENENYRLILDKINKSENKTVDDNLDAFIKNEKELIEKDFSKLVQLITDFKEEEKIEKEEEKPVVSIGQPKQSSSSDELIQKLLAALNKFKNYSNDEEFYTLITTIHEQTCKVYEIYENPDYTFSDLDKVLDAKIKTVAQSLDTTFKQLDEKINSYNSWKDYQKLETQLASKNFEKLCNYYKLLIDYDWHNSEYETSPLSRLNENLKSNQQRNIKILTDEFIQKAQSLPSTLKLIEELKKETLSLTMNVTCKKSYKLNLNVFFKKLIENSTLAQIFNTIKKQAEKIKPPLSYLISQENILIKFKDYLPGTLKDSSLSFNEDNLSKENLDNIIREIVTSALAYKIVCKKLFSTSQCAPSLFFDTHKQSTSEQSTSKKYFSSTK